MSNKNPSLQDEGAYPQTPPIPRIRVWAFLLRFLIALTLLFFLWIPLGPYYTIATLWPLTWLFPWLLGVPFSFDSAQASLWESAFTNVVPFLALMAATPGWKFHWKGRVWQLLLGLSLLFLFRVLDRFLGYWLTRVGATDAQIPTLSFFLYFLIQLGKILIPILLWLIFCWREIPLFPIRSTPPTTGSKKG